MKRSLAGAMPWRELLETGVLEDGREYKIVLQYGRGLFRLVAFDAGVTSWVFVSGPHEAHWWLLDPNERDTIVSSFLRRADEDSKARTLADTGRDASFRARYPAIHEWLSADAWPDGAARETSTLLFFVEGGQWKGCLNDRDQGRSLWAAGGALDAVLDAIEAHIQGGTGEWRQSGPKGSRGGKRK